MLRSLELVDVGPVARLRIDLSLRLNVFAGDNGLGKSFVLEVLWWALTGTWAELPAWPRPEQTGVPEIALTIERGEGPLRLRSRFDFARQQWESLPLHFSQAPLPALVLLARADGSFAVWDPARLRRPPAYIFEPKQLWNGLEADGKILCNGLIRDWVSWQRQKPGNGAGESDFELLRRILAELSPHPDRPDEVIRPGPPVRVFVDDARDFPTVDIGYGPVPSFTRPRGCAASWRSRTSSCGRGASTSRPASYSGALRSSRSCS